MLPNKVIFGMDPGLVLMGGWKAYWRPQKQLVGLSFLFEVRLA